MSEPGVLVSETQSDGQTLTEIRYDQECVTCDGTGLTATYNETNGTALVCASCHGTGCQTVVTQFKPFVERKDRNGVFKVFAANPYYVVRQSTGGGVGIREFEADPQSAFQPGAEMRERACPAVWYKEVDTSKVPDWLGCQQSRPRYGSCRMYPFKDKCWERWDRTMHDPLTHAADSLREKLSVYTDFISVGIAEVSESNPEAHLVVMVSNIESTVAREAPVLWHGFPVKLLETGEFFPLHVKNIDEV